MAKFLMESGSLPGRRQLQAVGVSAHVRVG